MRATFDNERKLFHYFSKIIEDPRKHCFLSAPLFLHHLSFFEKRLEKDSFFESESLKNLRLGLKVRVFVGLGLESDSDSDSDSKVESESESLKLSPALWSEEKVY